jgi:GNAT superfamily N-acetyltransferase
VIASLPLPCPVDVKEGPLTLRRAVEADLPALMVLLSDDPISVTRGDTSDPAATAAYRAALRELIDDPSNELVVVDDGEGVLAMMQLTRIPGMARRGAGRLLVEAVRVGSDRRSGGIGSAMMTWVTTVAAPATGATLVQLTSDERRGDAHRFYERLGFVGSHRGFKFVVG